MNLATHTFMTPYTAQHQRLGYNKAMLVWACVARATLLGL